MAGGGGGDHTCVHDLSRGRHFVMVKTYCCLLLVDLECKSDVKKTEVLKQQMLVRNTKYLSQGHVEIFLIPKKKWYQIINEQ